MSGTTDKRSKPRKRALGALANDKRLARDSNSYTATGPWLVTKQAVCDSTDFS